MTEERSSAERPSKDEELEDHERLIHRGLLKPDMPVWYAVPRFTLDDVQDALFRSTYSHPRYLEFELDQHQHGVELMQVAVSAVQAVYTTFEAGLGCFQAPEFMVYGWLPKSGYDPYPEIVPVRCFLSVAPAGAVIDQAFVQRLPSSQATWGIDDFNNLPG